MRRGEERVSQFGKGRSLGAVLVDAIFFERCFRAHNVSRPDCQISVGRIDLPGAICTTSSKACLADGINRFKLTP
jgi:hypothetical protein